MFGGVRRGQEGSMTWEIFQGSMRGSLVVVFLLLEDYTVYRAGWAESSRTTRETGHVIESIESPKERDGINLQGGGWTR